jgi:SAM-dependent methyltransferase
VGGRSTSPRFSWAEVEAWLEANDKLIDHEQSTLPRQPASTGPAAELAPVVASLLPTTRVGLVLDPACGRGVLLAAAARRLGASVAYAGQDPERSTVEFAREAVIEAGATAVELLVGSPLVDDALARYRGAADAVVCLPPGKSAWLADSASADLPWDFGTPSTVDPYLAWLQICYTYLRAEGAAVVAMPSSASLRVSGRRVRAELLRAGALRQVVALPDRFVQFAPVPWQIWVLRKPSERPMYTVRLVDLTRVGAERVPSTEIGWRAIYRDTSLTRDIASIELLDEDVLFLPGRHIDSPVRDVATEYERMRTRLVKAADDLDAELPGFRRSRDATDLPMTSVMALVRLGALRFIDRLAEPQAGDVLVSPGLDRFHASVIGDEAPDRPSGDVLLRCDEEVIDPYFLACFLRSESNGRQATGTSGSSRLDVRRARIPRIPLAAQQQYGDAFRRLAVVTERLDRLAAMAAEAVQTAVYGLTSGVFTTDVGHQSRRG